MERHSIHLRHVIAAFPFEADMRWLGQQKMRVVNILKRLLAGLGVGLFVFTMWIFERNGEAVC